MILISGEYVETAKFPVATVLNGLDTMSNKGLLTDISYIFRIRYDAFVYDMTESKIKIWINTVENSLSNNKYFKHKFITNSFRYKSANRPLFVTYLVKRMT